MKLKLFTLLVFTSVTYLSFAQGVWTQKTDYGGPVDYGGVGFSIGTKGYIVCGGTNLTVWEWDQATDVWTQKTSYPGDNSYKAMGFSIGTKGYYGTGNNAISFNSNNSVFYEFDPAANAWTVKASVPISTHASVGFSIGNKGYIVGGKGHTECYEYDPSTDSWAAKTPYPGLGRENLSAFSIGAKGYVGCGLASGSTNENDFWEFDPLANTWTVRASFGGSVRSSAPAFSIGTKGYIGTGFSGATNGYGGIYYNDFWEWDQSTNVWTAKTNFGGGHRGGGVGFSIGSQGYFGTGADSATGFHKDFWEFDASATSGVKDLQSKSGITIYPNPVGQVLYVKLSQPLQDETTLRIMDVTGRELSTQRINKMQNFLSVDVTSLQAGIYFIWLANSKEIFVKQ